MAAHRFAPDRSTYLRSHAWVAAASMAGAMAVLWALGNDHLWTGAVAGLAAIGIRGAFLYSEEMSAVWTLEADTLTGPAGQRLPLVQIDVTRTLGGTVQVIMKDGNKHLIRYQPDAQAVAARIEQARP